MQSASFPEALAPYDLLSTLYSVLVLLFVVGMLLDEPHHFIKYINTPRDSVLKSENHRMGEGGRSLQRLSTPASPRLCGISLFRFVPIPLVLLLWQHWDYDSILFASPHQVFIHITKVPLSFLYSSKQLQLSVSPHSSHSPSPSASLWPPKAWKLCGVCFEIHFCMSQTWWKKCRSHKYHQM